MKAVLFLLPVLSFHVLSAQKVILYDQRTVFWTHMENHVRILATEGNRSSLVFSTENGKLQQVENWLIYSPATPGRTLIKVYLQQTNKLTPYDSVEVMVYDNMYAEVRLGSKNGGAIKKDELVALGGIIAYYKTRKDHTDPVRIKSYTIIFHKNDGTVQYQANTGNKFNDNTLQYMRDLQPGERISFTNIRVEIPSSQNLQAKPVEFTIQ